MIKQLVSYIGVFAKKSKFLNGPHHFKNHTTLAIMLKRPVYRISLAARMSIILSHSEVLLGQNHRNLNCVSMHIFGVQNKKICIDTIQISMILAQQNLTVG